MAMISEADKKIFRNAAENQAPFDKDSQFGAISSPLKQPLFTAYSYVLEADIAGNEVLNYAKNSPSKKHLKAMKRGDISAFSLDLHGYTTIQTCEALSAFIHQHQNEQYLRIIHGKGHNSPDHKSILKSQVVRYLTQHPDVLAFHSCPPNQGGTGAVFVLLKTH